MTPVPYRDIEKAINRVRSYQHVKPGMLSQLQIFASSYVVNSDSWLMADEDARRIALLCGPYAAAILKIMEIRNDK